VDIDIKRARSVAESFPDAMATTDLQPVLADPKVQIVIVSTTHQALAEITMAAIQAGKHVLVEKPAARRSDELGPVIDIAKQKGVLVRVGFNHRYHPALIQARKLFESGMLGDLMFIRGRYGHGGRIDYDKEWRADPAVSGGGELLDQGIHLIDLTRWFLGDFSEVNGFAHTYFWDMPVDDNGFMILKTPRQQIAFLHVSWTEWKNLFSLEIYGRDAKLHIEGLGGSYGTERLAYYKMLPQMGPPETTIWEYPMGDKSWEIEFAEFCEDIRLNRKPAAGLEDALAALSIVETIYRSSGYDYCA
jgi:predicted dehydrogenase